MKTVTLSAACALGLLAGFDCLPSAHAEDAQQDFRVTNQTGTILDNLYVSADDENQWGEDILGQDTLDPGSSVDVHFSGYKKDECVFDIKIADTNGDSWVLQDANLCTTNEITFQKQGDKVVYTAK